MHRVIAALLAVASCATIAHAQTAPLPPSSSPPFTLERALIAAGASSPSDLPPAGPAVITRVCRFDIRAAPPAQARRT